MDIRNIKTNPPEHEGHILKNMLMLQDDLAKEYQKIEGITTKYPVNLNVKANQNILKDFTSRVIEEIAEGYESYEIIMDHHNECKYMDKEMLFNHLQNANEEQADAMGFFLELLLYIGITAHDILQHPLIESSGILRYSDNMSDIGILMKVGNTMLYQKGVHGIYVEDLFNKLLKHEKTPVTPGFTHMCIKHLRDNARMAWEVTYHLNIARNYLKNKPWKRTQQLSDEKLYKHEVITAFIYYCGMLSLNGFNDEDIYNLYYKKNQVNRFRQKSHY